MSNFNPTVSTDDFHVPLPSLDDSPLWREDFAPPGEPVQEERPPLLVIREHYPRIADAIELMWGDREMDTYFARLIVNDRNDRAGFPRDVMAAILKLSADHAMRFKFDQKQAMADTWGADRYSCHAFAK